MEKVKSISVPPPATKNGDISYPPNVGNMEKQVTSNDITVRSKLRRQCLLTILFTPWLSLLESCREWYSFGSAECRFKLPRTIIMERIRKSRFKQAAA